MIEKVHEPLVTAVLQDITRDRRGVSTYSNILRDVIHSFVEVRVLSTDLVVLSGGSIEEVKMRKLLIPFFVSPFFVGLMVTVIIPH